MGKRKTKTQNKKNGFAICVCVLRPQCGMGASQNPRKRETEKLETETPKLSTEDRRNQAEIFFFDFSFFLLLPLSERVGALFGKLQTNKDRPFNKGANKREFLPTSNEQKTVSVCVFRRHNKRSVERKTKTKTLKQGVENQSALCK